MRTQLKRHRLERGLSSRRLAEVLGVDPRTVNKWQAGEAYPHPKHRVRLETLFGKPVAVILAPETKDPAEAGPRCETLTSGDKSNVCD